MTAPYRWTRCARSRGADAVQFVREYFSRTDRRALVVAGAGFDPRAPYIPRLLGATMPGRVSGMFIREQRAGGGGEAEEIAGRHTDLLRQAIPAHTVEPVDVFAEDGAVVGGRQMARLVCGVSLGPFTDVVVDVSALSLGIAFPAVRQLYERAVNGDHPFNLHVLATDEPQTDALIAALPSDRAECVFGFRGGWRLDRNADAARLWLPQLITGGRAVLARVYAHVEPHDVCPILPFPSRDPQLGDRLIEHYSDELESTWEVDTRNLIYADERDPLDVYRMILRIDDARRQVFEGVGGSQVLLSPMGSRLLAVGSLLAALERDFPVMYVEALGYVFDRDALSWDQAARGELAHICLHEHDFAQLV